MDLVYMRQSHDEAKLVNKGFQKPQNRPAFPFFFHATWWLYFAQALYVLCIDRQFCCSKCCMLTLRPGCIEKPAARLSHAHYQVQANRARVGLDNICMQTITPWGSSSGGTRKKETNDYPLQKYIYPCNQQEPNR